MSIEAEQLETRLRTALGEVADSIVPDPQWNLVEKDLSNTTRSQSRRLYVAAVAASLLIAAALGATVLRSDAGREIVDAASGEDPSGIPTELDSPSFAGFEVCEQTAVDAAVSAGGELPTGPFEDRIVFRVPGSARLVVTLLFSSEGMIACEMSETIDSESLASSLSASLVAYPRTVGADEVVLVEGSWTSSADDPGIGPGRGYMIGRAGTDVSNIRLTTAEGEIFTAEVQGNGWFGVQTRTSAGLPLFRDSLQWETGGTTNEEPVNQLLDNAPTISVD